MPALTYRLPCGRQTGSGEPLSYRGEPGAPGQGGGDGGGQGREAPDGVEKFFFKEKF